MAEESGKKIVRVRTTDGDEFEVDEEVAREWVTIDHMIQDDCADSVIPLPNVSSRILRKVIDYCTKHVHLRAAVAEEAAAEAAQDAADKAAVAAMTCVFDKLDAAAKAAANKDAAPMIATNELNTFDANFLHDVDQATLFDLIKAANYLNIKELLDLTCQTVTNMIKGKTPEQLREIFNIVNDYTPEEEAKLRKDNKWAFE